MSVHSSHTVAPIPITLLCPLPFCCKVWFHVSNLCHLCLLPIVTLHIHFPCSHSPTHYASLTHHLTSTHSIKIIPSLTINNIFLRSGKYNITGTIYLSGGSKVIEVIKLHFMHSEWIEDCSE
jgi:hypothetical protein